MKLRIEASIMCADLLHIADEIIELSRAGVDAFHFDIMDRHFVDNLALSPMIANRVRSITEVPFEFHLMVDAPLKYLDDFAIGNADTVIIHYEAVDDMVTAIDQIRAKSARVGLALNPETSPEPIMGRVSELDQLLLMTVEPGYAGGEFIPGVLKKIRQAKRVADEQGLPLDIGVDGHITAETIPLVVAAGANVLVSGSTGIFANQATYSEYLQDVRAVVARTLRTRGHAGTAHADPRD